MGLRVKTYAHGRFIPVRTNRQQLSRVLPACKSINEYLFVLCLIGDSFALTKIYLTTKSWFGIAETILNAHVFKEVTDNQLTRMIESRDYDVNTAVGIRAKDRSISSDNIREII